MGGIIIINTFIIDSGDDECYELFEIELSIVTSIEPVFDDISLCENDEPYTIPNISNNGLGGNWTPNIIDPSGLGGTIVPVVFMPENSGCVSNVELGVIIEASITPIFNLNTNLCTSSDIIVLPDTDDNGVFWELGFLQRLTLPKV